jgi:hypothetical protein
MHPRIFFNIFNIPGILMACGCELLLCGPLGFEEWFWLYQDTQEVSIAGIERLPSVLNLSKCSLQSEQAHCVLACNWQLPSYTNFFDLVLNFDEFDRLLTVATQTRQSVQRSGGSSHRLESRKLEPFLGFGGRARRLEPFFKDSSLFGARFSP